MKHLSIFFLIFIFSTNLFGRRVMVSSAAEITTAMNVGAPGDTLIMVGNIWTDQLILFGGANGTLSNPIVLMPEIPGTIKLEDHLELKFLVII
ncbi:MAG: hypothetical protein IPL98_09930 [Saprospiraceae bacterium]|nr:hypothetical protein [Saprospiraceae bacterium]